MPNGNTQLREKDVVNICGKHYDISDFLHEYGMLKRKGQYVMILGANKNRIISPIILRKTALS